MKLKFKAMVVAAAMAVAGHASAALSDTFVTNGTLQLTVYDAVTFKSYTRDLGVALDDFLPTGALVSSAGVVKTAGDYNFAGSSLFSSFFASSLASNLRWTITGVDAIESEGAGNGSRYVSTQTAAPVLLNGAIRNLAANTVGFAGELINNSGVDYSGAPAEGAFQGTGALGFEGATWASIYAGTGSPDVFATGFGDAQFWYAATSNDDLSNDSGNGTATRFGNSTNFAKFSLATDGTVTYSLAADSVAAVPIPAAAWLLGSGLIGLGGMVRRRRAAKASA